MSVFNALPLCKKCFFEFYCKKNKKESTRMKTQNLIAKILDRKLKNEIENILAITQQGFDLYIHTEFSEIVSALNRLLECEIKINPRIFRLISDPAEIEITNDDDLD